MSPRRLWWVAFFLVLVGGQSAVGMRASTTATVTGDEPFYLATAQSLVSDGDLDLGDEYAFPEAEMARFWDGTKPLWKQMKPAPDGRLLSPHDPGLSILIAPAYAVGGLEGVRRFLVVVWAAAMAFGALAARRWGAPARFALLAAVGLGVGAPGVVYASQVYPEGPAALCLAVGMLAAGRRTWWAAVGVVSSVVSLEWLGVKYLPYALVLAGLWAWNNRASRSRLAATGAVAAVAGVHAVWWHLVTFGGLTPYSTNVVFAGEGTAAIVADHVRVGARGYRVYGLFLDARFGLLRWSPLAVLAAVGVRRRTWLPSMLMGVAVALGAFVSITIMGYWFPGRMLVAAFPALVVLVALGAARFPRMALGLAAWALAIGAATAWGAHHGQIRLAVDPWTLGFPLAPAALFPDFRSFGLTEVARSLGWGAAVAVLVLVGRRRSGGETPA